MRHGNVQSFKSRKEHLCRHCSTVIEINEYHLALTYKRKAGGWFAIKFHADCFRFYTLGKYEENLQKPKKGSAGIKGGRPRIDLAPEIKHRRRILLMYLNTRDVRRIIEAYKRDKGIKKHYQQMIAHIDELEEIGVPYPQPLKRIEDTLREYDEPLLLTLAPATWSERVEILRERFSD